MNDKPDKNIATKTKTLLIDAAGSRRTIPNAELCFGGVQRIHTMLEHIANISTPSTHTRLKLQKVCVTQWRHNAEFPESSEYKVCLVSDLAVQLAIKHKAAWCYTTTRQMLAEAVLALAAEDVVKIALKIKR